MPRIKLTLKSVAKLRAPTATGKPILYWDEGPKSVRGFGVLCSGKTASKTYVAQRDLPNGKTRRVTIAAVNEKITLDAAREEAAEYVLAMRKGVDPKAKRKVLTLRGALDDYHKARTQLRPRSEEHYKFAVERHLADWADRPLNEITRAMVEARHKKIAEDVEARNRRAAADSAKRFEAKAAKAEAAGWPAAAARHRAAAAKAAQRVPTSGHTAANNAMRVLRMLWNRANRDGTLGPNPVQLGKEWFPLVRRDRRVRPDEVARFHEAVMRLENPVQRDYLRLLMYTGLRRREAAGLRWEDVDLRARLVRISAANTKANRKLDLPMSDQLRDMLVARRALGNSGFVFPANSRSGHIEEPKAPLRLVAAASGIHISVHDLRRTFASTAHGCGVSLHILKALLNHAGPSPSGDVTAAYVGVSEEEMAAAAQKVADKLSELCGVVEPAGENVHTLKA